MSAAMLSPSQAAIYALATRFIVLGQFAAQSLQQVVAPHFSELFAQGLHDSAMRLARIITVWTVLLVWPVYLFSITDGAALLRLLGGPAYAAGAAALAILAAGMLFASMTGPVDTILLMAGRSAISLTTTAVALAVDIALSSRWSPDGHQRGCRGMVRRALRPIGPIAVLRPTHGRVHDIQLVLGVGSRGRARVVPLGSPCADPSGSPRELAAVLRARAQ